MPGLTAISKGAQIIKAVSIGEKVVETTKVADRTIQAVTSSSLKKNVAESLEFLESKNWSVNRPGVANGKRWDNLDPKTGESVLPNGAKYKEYDVNPKVQGQGRDAERFVRSSDGKTYYTSDHYKSFVEIKK